MNSFIILFHGREGSSAIITQLASHPEIRVPLFEHFDQANARKFWPETEPADLIDFCFRTGCRPNHSANSNKISARVTGFKWRAWGDEERSMQVLKKYDTKIFHLFRVDLLEYAASKYLNDHVVPSLAEVQEYGLEKGAQVQFKFKDMPDDARESLRAVLRRKTFDLPVEFAVEYVSRLTEGKKRTEQRFLKLFERNGIEIRHIRYEDYVSSPEDFLDRFCSEICVSTGIVLKTQFKKVASREIISQVRNINDLRSHQGLCECIDSFDALFKSRPGI